MLALRMLGASLLFVVGTGFANEVNTPPKTWVDEITGHRIWRITDEEKSSSLYFNYNAFTSDGKWMVYTTPYEIKAVNLNDFSSKVLFENKVGQKVKLISVGRKSSAAYLNIQNSSGVELIRVNVHDSKVDLKIGLPLGVKIDSINSDETLAAGTFERDPTDNSKMAVSYPGTVIQSSKRGEMLYKRFDTKIPLSLFTVDLNTGQTNEILKSNDWINHLQFSPTDPSLLMFCHEGPWHKVDRIWTIRTDGSEKNLIHSRTMVMEITGHEFWSSDGKVIWYDWQYPKGKNFFLAGRDLQTGKRYAYPIEKDDWAIHFNISQDGKIFVGDGGDSGQVAKAKNGRWITMFTPLSDLAKDASNFDSYWQYSNLRREHLVDMTAHDYKLEPNVRISPDKRYVIFRSNMFGENFVFAVETEKAKTGSADIKNTAALALKFREEQ